MGRDRGAGREQKVELEAAWDVRWTDDKVFESVSKVLAGTEAAGGKDAIKKSYLRVQRLMKEGKGSIFAPLEWGNFSPKIVH